MNKKNLWEDLIFLGTNHKNDNISKLIAEPVALPLAYLFLQRPRITPNIITMISLLLGMLSAAFIWRGLVIHSAVFYYLTYALDFVDGKIARIKGDLSAFGMKLDYRVDRAVFLMLAISYIGMFGHNRLVKELLMFTIYVALFTYLDIIYFTSYIYKHMITRQIPELSEPTRQTRLNIFSPWRNISCWNPTSLTTLPLVFILAPITGRYLEIHSIAVLIMVKEVFLEPVAKRFQTTSLK